MSKTLHGEVELVVGESTYVLKPTLAAVRAIERQFGGLRGALEVTRALSVEGCAAIIAAGAGVNEKAAAQLVQDVWQTGVLTVSVPVAAYVAALYNPRGGEPEQGKA